MKGTTKGRIKERERPVRLKRPKTEPVKLVIMSQDGRRVEKVFKSQEECDSFLDKLQSALKQS